ncbi:MAG TPA: hypothetical protein VLU25_10340 [Acidobacteriota bacterium]|nr:hypothetical protein [Acidobacteriota bacterium]
MRRFITLGLLCLFLVTGLGSGEHPAFRTDVTSPAPWTDRPIRAEGREFSFAVVGDRAGGTRLGVFAAAVEKLNELQPAFVMSVGDLKGGNVPGLASTPEIRDKHILQWQYFDELVNRLDMRFFYVGGNADFTVGRPQPFQAPDDLKKRIWAERYGPTYYTFVFQDVLFVVLDTDDPPFEHGRGFLNFAQRDWLTAELAKHPDPRWTFVFFHKPLWRDTPEQWEEIDKILPKKRITVFSGHYHRYAKEKVKGRRHYSLSATGGAITEGEPGAFDHLMWVTVTDKKPKIKNIRLKIPKK